MDIKVNRENFRVNNDEFMLSINHEYNKLRILEGLGEYERFVSLLKEISLIFDKKQSLSMVGVTHGGYIPIQIKDNYSNIFLYDVKEPHKSNILKNFSDKGIDNVFLSQVFFPSNVVVIDEDDIRDDFSQHLCRDISNMPLVVCRGNYNFRNIIEKYSKVYTLSRTNYFICVPDRFVDRFYEEFHYFMGSDGILDYDNLINLNIMVKNGGPIFEQMLTENLPIIDRWTILDTGSTDNTVDIINRVLVGRKKGKLYQEPFINFRDSRNRCLDLAGKECKYNLMLDDTYFVKGELRDFLNKVRGDQFANSFSLYIRSDDNEYTSNRITNSKDNLRYIFKIHEVINPENNNNVCIPIDKTIIFDYRTPYMEERTLNRKEYDLKLLFEECEEDPNNPRHIYYIAQTYNLLGKKDLAYEYFLKRANHPNTGFIQEKIDALFEAARIGHFYLNKPWDECESLYTKSWDLDKNRPESFYFIGMKHKLDGNDIKAYKYMKRSFEIGYPINSQHSLKPTLSYYFLPKFLVELCYKFENYELGLKASKLFLEKNNPNSNYYEIMISWFRIFSLLVMSQPNNLTPAVPEIPYFCFIADGGFESWTGRDITHKGIGGSETYIIELARYIQKSGKYNVVVFCRCEEEDNFEGVLYLPIMKLFNFLSKNIIQHCIVSRFSEYIPVCINSNAENVHLVLHDLGPSGLVIPQHQKLKNIFCLTDWHVDFFLQNFPMFKNITSSFSYGVDFNNFKNKTEKQPLKFIYSSFANRGLLVLLKLWPRVINKFPEASLHIYCDVNAKWPNEVDKDHMQELKKLLETLSTNTSMNINYHGWVGKKELSNAWLSSDIWFYPCIFKETFCLTALEAAITKTLAVTSDLAALNNTVSDRGILIKGDANTVEWQEKSLEQLFSIIEDPNLKNNLINKNYEWASNLSWEKRANDLLKILDNQK